MNLEGDVEGGWDRYRQLCPKAPPKTDVEKPKAWGRERTDASEQAETEEMEVAGKCAKDT